MSTRKLLAAVVLLSAASSVMAQDVPQPPPTRPNGDARPNFSGPGPGGMRDRAGNRGNALKEALEATDDQWKQLQPKLDQVQQLRRDLATTNGFGMMGGGMMGGPGMGGPGMGGPPSGGPGGPGPRGGGDHFAAGGPTTQPSGDRHGAAGLAAHHQGPPTGGGNFRGPGAPGAPGFGPGGFGEGTPAHPSAVRTKFDDLQDALDDKDAKPEDLRAKIDAYHKARAQSVADLSAAQDELRKLLNPTQEAVLITAGVLD